MASFRTEHTEGEVGFVAELVSDDNRLLAEIHLVTNDEDDIRVVVQRIEDDPTVIFTVI